MLSKAPLAKKRAQPVSDGEEGTSASSSKLRCLAFDPLLDFSSSDESYDDSDLDESDSEDSACELASESTGYRLVDVECLESLISSACRCHCGGALSPVERKQWGLASE